jgi:hypothetical protein
MHSGSQTTASVVPGTHPTATELTPQKLILLERVRDGVSVPAKDIPATIVWAGSQGAGQNKKRAPNWISRDGSRVLVIRPNCEFPNDVFGLLNSAWLKMLNISIRSSMERVLPSAVRLNTEKSVVTIFGPRTCPIS